MSLVLQSADVFTSR